jgi:hypothetical protein
MRPSILAAFAEAIPYIPGLRQQTGSVVATILMMQLEYRFAKYPEGFYKFLEPPQNGHQDYKIGDSWVEELAFSKEEFRTGFDKIGVRYNSKTQYDEAKSSGSEFGSSYYCSYVDRRSGLTFYFRNHSKVDELISDIEPRQKSMGFRPRKTRPQIVDPDLREIGNPNLPDVVFSEVSKSGFPIYQSGESQFTDPYIDISEKTSEKTSEKIPPTPQGGTGLLSQEGEKSTGEEDRNRKIVEPPQDLKQDLPEQIKSSSEDQTSPAPTPIFSVHKKEHQDRIVAVYQSNKPAAWLPVNNLHRDIRVMVDSLLSSENFQGDLEAFLTRLENALKEINDPTTKFGWFRNQGNLGLRTLLSNYGRHLMEISDRFLERQKPQTQANTLPDWALEAQREIEARQLKKAG